MDGGSTFEDTVNLSNNKGTSSSPIIYTSTTTAANNDLYVLWSDNSTGNFDVLYKRSIDGGYTFEDTVNLSNNKGISSSPIMLTPTTEQITTFMFFGAIILQEILMCCIKGVLMVDLHLKIQST